MRSNLGNKKPDVEGERVKKKMKVNNNDSGENRGEGGLR